MKTYPPSIIHCPRANRARVPIFTLFLFLAAFLLFHTPRALAASRSWTGGNLGFGTSWNSAINWNPNGLPQPAEDIRLAGGSGLDNTIFYDFTGATGFNSLTISHVNNFGSQSSTTLSIAANTLNTAYETVGDSRSAGNTGRGIVNQSGGSNIITGSGHLILGYNPTDLGIYTLSSGFLGIPTLGGLDIGLNGTGTFIQSGGSVNFTTSGYLSLAGEVGSHASYQLTAGNLSATTVYIGYFGNATYTQSGGFASWGGDTTLARFSQSVATFTLTNGTVIALDEYVGYDGTATFNHSGGQHSVTNLRVSNSTYNLSAAGQLNSTEIDLGYVHPASFVQSGGFNFTKDLIINMNSTYTLASGLLSAHGDSGGAILLGSDSPATFTQTGGTLNADDFVLHSFLTAPAFDAIYNLSAGSASFTRLSIGAVSSHSANNGGSAVINQSGGSILAGTVSCGLSQNTAYIYNMSGGSLFAGAVYLSGNHLGSFNISGNAQVTVGNLITTDPLNLSGGSLRITTDWQNFGTANLTGGTVIVTGQLVLKSNGTYSGKINLSGGKLIVQSSSPADKTDRITQLNDAITTGANGTAWNGLGISSTLLQSILSNSYGIGLFDNAILNKTTFGGQPADTNSLFITVAHLGDANLNGIVDIQDLTIVANNWQQPRNTWTTGDLNRDNLVNLQDLTIVANNWQQTSSFPLQPSSLLTPQDSGLASVPEPSSLLLMAFGCSVLLRRRSAPR